MDTSVKMQIYIFVTSLYGGLIAGLFYDIYRITRYYFKPKSIATIVEDFIFWIGVSLIFFYILHNSSWTELRAYVFIGFFAGGLIYLRIVSRTLFPLLIKIVDGIVFIIAKGASILALPFKYIGRKMSFGIKRLKKGKGVIKESISNIKRYTSIILKKK